MIFFKSKTKEYEKRIKRLKKRNAALERKLGKSRRMENIMESAARRNPGVRTVIDVGAAKGWFSGLAQDTYPGSHLLLFEPQTFHREQLEAFCEERENAAWVAAAAGRERGTIFFDATDPFGGQASYTAYESNNIEVPVTTIDLEVAERGLPGPYLIKLDTHGFEVPILDGATETLKQTSVLILECYNWRMAPECLLFDEMVVFLRERGFRCVDASSPHMLKGTDDRFWVDLVFTRGEDMPFEES